MKHFLIIIGILKLLNIISSFLHVSVIAMVSSLHLRTQGITIYFYNDVSVPSHFPRLTTLFPLVISEARHFYLGWASNFYFTKFMLASNISP